MAKLIAHREQPIPSLRATCPDVPEEIEVVFRQMLAKSIGDRYQSMTEVITALEQCGPRQEQSVNIKQSLGTFSDSNLTNFLKEATLAPKKPLRRKKVARPFFGKGEKKYLLIGGGILGVLLLVLAGVVVKLTTKDGTLIVTVNEPDAQVEVRSEMGEIEITRKGEKGPITISVDPGKHQLRVQKDGFALVTKEFEIESGGEKTITAKLVPVKGKPVVTTAGGHDWPADAPPPAIAPFDAKQARSHQAAWAKHLGVPVEYKNTIGMKFVLIPPGEFMMGSTAAEMEAALVAAGEDTYWKEHIPGEGPQHKVILTQPLYLGVHEVTQAQYEKVMGQNPSHFAASGPGKEAVVGLDTSSYPVEMVSWNDAAEFCAKLSEQEQLKPFYFRSGESVTMLDGTGYRLPTEAEWEFSCRAGTTTRYWIGDKDEALPAAGWFGVNSGGRTHAVGELKSNPLGLYDIHGNVWEWVQDGWESTYYSQFQERPALDPSVPSPAGSRRVYRGGTWVDLASRCRASDRHANDPTGRGSSIGFRLALAVGVSRVRR